MPGGECDGVRDAAVGALIAHMEHGGDRALAVNQPARGFPNAARAAATDKDPTRRSGGSNRYVLPSPFVATTPSRCGFSIFFVCPHGITASPSESSPPLRLVLVASPLFMPARFVEQLIDVSRAEGRDA